MPKRTRPAYERESPTPSSPPAKRSNFLRQSASSPIRPRRSSLPPSTPFAYYTARTPLTVPLDSPTNPFGLKRTLTALELPRVTSFGRHIGLRMQLVDTRPGRGLALNRRDRTGVFRVVQVPLNYTFRHLHKLILFLFASDIAEAHAHLPSARRDSLRSATGNCSSVAKGKGRAVEPLGHSASKQWGGHYFEVMKQATVHRDSSSKPGVLMPGAKVHTKLSSVRERRLFGDLLDPENSMESPSDLPKALEDEDEEVEDWRWEAEDDYMLGQVWPRGPVLDRAIVYHHQPNISIHITANTLPIESRKGSSNTPHVFIAQGTAGPAIRIAHTEPTADGGEAAFDVHGTLPDGALAVSKTHIDRWNKSDAFQTFLRRECERERALQRRPPSPQPESQPQLSISPVRPHRVVSPGRGLSEAPTVPSSDPAFLHSEGESDASIGAYSDSAVFPFAFSAITPYPAHPLHRKRMQRAERRMARLTRSGLVDMVSSDEEASKKGKDKDKDKGKGKGKEKETRARAHTEEQAEHEQQEELEEEYEEEPEEEMPDAPEVKIEEVELGELLGRHHAKENIRTYAHRPMKPYMRGGHVGRGARRVAPTRSSIEWTPPSLDNSFHSQRGYASVEI